MKKTSTVFTALAALLLSGNIFGQIIFEVTNPVPVQGLYDFEPAEDWGRSLSDTAVSGFGALVDDGTAADSLGCNALTNSASIAGKIAFVYRGTCEFGQKALRAQNAGAIAVVVINNVDGTMAMGAGAQGASVTIPVVMIGKQEGILLRPYLNAGTLELFIGSKQNLFNFDLGITPGDPIRPLNYATPSLLVPGAEELQNMQIGSVVRNFGSQPQSNVTLTARIDLNGSQIWQQSTTVSNLNSGDSTFLSLPSWTIPNANVAKYTLTYTASSANTDEENTDNTISQDFYVTNGVYCKSRFDAATNKPIRNAGLTATNPSITWGIVMNAVLGNNLKATGIQFSASTRTTDSLTGQLVSGILFEWNDANSDGGVTDDELVEIAVGFYSFESDLQNEVLTIDLGETPGDGPALAANKVYLAAVQYEGTVPVFFGVDQDLDYNETINAYGQSVNPLNSEGTWFGGGFGTDQVLAIALNTAFNNVSINEDLISALNLSVYPNPATDAVNVVFGHPVANSDVEVRVLDVTGKTILTQQYAIGTAENYVALNTQSIAAGAYYVQVSLNGKAGKSLPLIIAR